MLSIEIDLTEADFDFNPDRDFAGLLQVMQSRALSVGESRFGEVQLSRTGERLGSIFVLRTCAEYDAEDERRSAAEIGEEKGSRRRKRVTTDYSSAENQW